MKTKVLILFLLSLFTLSACGNAEVESAEQVILKFKESVKEVKSIDFTATLNMIGNEAEDNVAFDLEADVKVDRLEEGNQKMDIRLDMGGSFKAGEDSMAGNLSFQIRTLGDELYFNVESVEADDPQFASFLPMISPYLGKWMTLPSDFIPEEIKQLQEKDAEALALEEEMKDLFVNTKLFDVSKEFGVETLGGKKLYHYGLKADKEGFRTYLKKLATIEDTEIPETELEEALLLIDGITNIEVWIGVKDYFLYKGVVEINGENLDQGLQAKITLNYLANSYNESLKITAPEDAEEFNPLSLLLGGGIPGMGDELEDDFVVPDVEGLEFSDFKG